MVGNLQDAQTAYNKVKFQQRPKGWKTIGEGCSRTVVRAPDGVVYKIGMRGGKHNIAELQAFKRYRRWKSLKDKNIYVPPMTGYKVKSLNGWEQVNAMPFIDSHKKMTCAVELWPFDKDCNCHPERRPDRMCYGSLMEWMSDRGIQDMWSGNIHHSSDGRYYIIDLGHN